MKREGPPEKTIAESCQLATKKTLSHDRCQVATVRPSSYCADRPMVYHPTRQIMNASRSGWRACLILALVQLLVLATASVAFAQTAVIPGVPANPYAVPVTPL